MDIIYSLKDTKGLFSATTIEELKNEISEFYSIHGAKPDVRIEEGMVLVHIDTKSLEKAEKSFAEAIKTCQKGDFAKAIPLLEETIKICPHHVDAYRNLAQIQMLNHEVDKAINNCIEALRWEPRNVNSLILMGNLFNRNKDLNTSERYYQSALEYEPDNTIASTNLAALKLQLGKHNEAIPLFQSVIKNDSTCLNSYYGLALSFYQRDLPGDIENAFNIALEGLLKAKDRVENPGIRNELINLTKATAQTISKKDFKNVIDAAVDLIRTVDDTPIIFKEDSSLTVSAKLQLSKVIHRDYHQILCNPTKPYATHLKMHELMHLDLVTKAEKKNSNKFIVITAEQKALFRKKFGPAMIKYQAKLGKDGWINMMDNLCDNICLQAMNCPLDLLVEDKIYNDFKVLRPIQMLSLFAQELENIQAIQKSMQTPVFPPAIVSASKIMNMVTSLHLKQLYGLDMIKQYKPTKAEYDCAKDLYDEYLAYEGYKPGEEYDLVEYFAVSLNLKEFLTCSPEDEYLRTRGFLNSESEYQALEDLDKVTSDSNYAQKANESNKTFEEEHSKGDPMVSMMMSMYMVGAMQTFKTWSMEEIHKAAFEIAMLGMKGINPQNKNGYQIPSIPDKDMSGYQMIAYYYVSWAISEPENLPRLGLSMFDDAYRIAKQMYDSQNSK